MQTVHCTLLQRDGISWRIREEWASGEIQRPATQWQVHLSLHQHKIVTLNISACFTVAPLSIQLLSIELTCAHSDRHRRLLGWYDMKSSSVITGRYWGHQWQPGGSTLVGCHSAGCRCLSDGFSLITSSSFWSCHSHFHAFPDWTRSSQPSLAGAAGSSPWEELFLITIGYIQMSTWFISIIIKTYTSYLTWCIKKYIITNPHVVQHSLQFKHISCWKEMLACKGNTKKNLCIFFFFGQLNL